MNTFEFGFTHGTRSMPGIRATCFVPYRGDKALFLCQPNTFTTVLPFAEVGANELRFTFERPDQNVGATKQAFDSDLATVKQHLGWLNENAKVFNASLPSEAQQLITARRRRLAELQQGTDSLGITIRRPGAPAAVVSGTVSSISRSSRATAPSKFYDVALSSAGEDRAYVEQVATGSKTSGVEVFYDAFEKVDLWGKNLVDHLADIYQKKSRYVVMFISEHYVRKAWPQHERQHAQARALVAKDEYIFPARFDDTDVPGMTNTVGYVDLRKISAGEMVDLILGKLGKKRP